MDMMNISSMQELIPKNTSADNYAKLSANKKKLSAKDMELKNACTEFEAVLTSTILKEGLNSAMKMNDDDRDNGCKTYMEIANEQMAMHVGRSGMLGIGKTMYEQMKLRAGGQIDGK
jgi:Rod binding domain-containing protein